MRDTVSLFFNGWGWLSLIAFAAAFSFPLLAARGLKRLEFYCKVIGTISLVLIFILSGLKTGLIAIPVTFVCSLLGVLLAITFARSNE